METKTRILKVTFELLLEKGFDGVSISQITKKAEITKGALYYFFENKEDLFDCVIEEYLYSYLNQSLIDLKSFSGTTKEKIEMSFHAAINNAMNEKIEKSDHSDISLIDFSFLVNQGAKKYEKIRKQYNNFTSDVVNTLEGLLEQGKSEGIIRPEIDSRMIAENNVIWGKGLILSWSINPEMDTTKIIETHFECIWNFIAIDLSEKN